jgi:sugar/nucleoside kinase (ribokinase family)
MSSPEAAAPISGRPLDVVGIGSAIVDVIAHADDEFLAAHDMTKGAMQLVFTEDGAQRVYDALPPAVESSGGSCANTLAGLASFGGAGAFVGVVRDDQLGEVFAHDLRAVGVAYDTPPATDGPATARCMIVVTPDAQRTLNTYLGAASGLTPDHIDPALIARAQVVYLEGYLWDLPDAKRAMVTAMEAAASADTRVSFTLSDGFCVDRHRAEFLELVERHVDVLFANEDEICSLYQVSSFDEALQAVRDHCAVSCLTRSEKGSVVVAGDEVHVVDAHPVPEVVDTTGAGDLYAAGFLYGYTRGRGLAESARLGSLAAAEVISHLGARPLGSLAELSAEFDAD